MGSETPVALSPDLFRHDPISIEIVSPEFGQVASVIQSRYISDKGMVLEFLPPLGDAHPFKTRVVLELKFRFPHDERPLTVSAKVLRIVPRGLDPDRKEISLVSLQFKSLPPQVIDQIRALEIETEARKGRLRSARIPVRFPVEPGGIDVISTLMARDLSMTGMFVSSRAKFPAGKILQLGFRLPFQQAQVSLTGKVIWEGEKPIPGLNEKVRGFGLHFMEVPATTRNAMAVYYARFVLPPRDFGTPPA